MRRFAIFHAAALSPVPLKVIRANRKKATGPQAATKITATDAASSAPTAGSLLQLVPVTKKKTRTFARKP